MSISYRYFPEQKLIFEVVNGTVTIDDISTFFMKLQSDKYINEAKYFITDHKNMSLKLSNNELKRAGRVFNSFSDNINIKKWAIIYKDLENKEKLEMALSIYKQEHKIEIQFFYETNDKEVCEFLGLNKIPKL